MKSSSSAAALAQLIKSLEDEYFAAKSKPSASQRPLTPDSYCAEIELKFAETLRQRLREIDTSLDGSDETVDLSDARSEHNRTNRGGSDGTIDDGPQSEDEPTAHEDDRHGPDNSRDSKRPVVTKSHTILPAEYELLDTLGRGGMGVVYMAKHRTLNRLVAIKMVISGKHASKSILQRFQHEAESAAKLSHPNIVAVHEVGQHEGMPYLSIEYVDGPTLSKLLRGSSMTSQRAVEIIEQIARAVHYSHDRGIVHRDLKPQNIMLTKSGIPKIADFGLAKRLGETDDHTRTGEILGTPGYMSPEQARGEKSIGPSTDIYALGAILYSAVTGRAPFVGPTPVNTIQQVVAQDPVPPSKLQPQLDRDLETICLKCLEKEIDRRYASAADMAADLQRVREGRPIVARPVSTSERLWKWCKRNPRVATLSGTAASLLLTLLLGGYVAAGLINQQKTAEAEAKERATAAQALAETNAKAAREAQANAEENAEAAKAARQKAEENEELAEDQAELALDAARTVLYETQQFFKDRSELTELRQTLLNVILTKLEGVYAESYSYDVKEVFHASALRQLAEIYIEAGVKDKALEKLQESEAIAKRLFESDELPNPHMNLSNLDGWIGKLLRDKGQYQEALKRFDSMLAHRKIYFEKNPKFSDMLAEQSYAHVFGLLGSVYQRTGDFEKSEKYYAKCVDARRKWYEEDPERFERIAELAGSLGSLSSYYEATAQFVEMKKAKMEQLTLLRSLVDRNANYTSTANVALAESRFGKQCVTVRENQLAVDVLKGATESYEKLLKDRPGQGLIQWSAATAYYCQGIALERLNQGGAKESYRRAIELEQALLKKSKSVEYEGHCLFCLARAGDREQALEIAERFSAQEESAVHAAYAGLGYGMLARAATEDELAEQFSNKAVTLIQRFIRKGGITDFNMLRGKTDFDFAELMLLPGYQTMLDVEQARLASLSP